MKNLKIFITAAALLVSLTGRLYATPTMAFGYLTNMSQDSNYDYLETIFPNSFANSIKNIFDVHVIKPHKINERLKEYREELAKDYKSYELPEIIEKIDSDLFIYGNFTPLPNNRIKIVLNLYANGSNRIFTFTNIGRMETEIFKLVDRITQILLNFMGDDSLYLNDTVAEKSRLGILTNLDGAELNRLYCSFMQKGYRIMSVQGNEIRNITDETLINRFRNIYTDDNYYDIITDIRKIRFLFGTWSGTGYIEKVQEFRNIFKKYDYNYPETKNSLLQRLQKAYDNKIDYLIIIGFDEDRESAWIRCIDMNKRDLILMQTGLEGDSIEEITGSVIKRMNTPLKELFKKK